MFVLDHAHVDKYVLNWFLEFKIKKNAEEIKTQLYIYIKKIYTSQNNMHFSTHLYFVKATNEETVILQEDQKKKKKFCCL